MPSHVLYEALDSSLGFLSAPLVHHQAAKERTAAWDMVLPSVRFLQSLSTINLLKSEVMSGCSAGIIGLGFVTCCWRRWPSRCLVSQCTLGHVRRPWDVQMTRCLRSLSLAHCARDFLTQQPGS